VDPAETVGVSVGVSVKREKGLIARLALAAREAHRRGEPGFEYLGYIVGERLKSGEKDEEKVWIEAVEKEIAWAFWKGLKEFGLPRTAKDVEGGFWIGSYERPAPGESVRAETEERARKEIIFRWVRRILQLI
jgi:hypothetical protein